MLQQLISVNVSGLDIVILISQHNFDAHFTELIWLIIYIHFVIMWCMQVWTSCLQLSLIIAYDRDTARG